MRSLHILDEWTGRSRAKTLTQAPEPQQRVTGHRRMTRAEKEQLLAHAFTEYADSGVQPRTGGADAAVLEFGGGDACRARARHRAAVRQQEAAVPLQWQHKQGERSEGEYTRFVAETVEPRFKELSKMVEVDKTLEPRIVYGWLPCYGRRNSLVVLDHRDRKTEPCRVDFPRQPSRRRLSLSDFFRRKDSGQLDVVGFSLVTIGAVATRESKRLFRENRFDEYLHFHGISFEGAEALAE